MNLKKIIEIYNIIKERLPSTYYKPKLVFYEDEDSLVLTNKLKKEEGYNIYACVDPESQTIHLPLKMSFRHYNKNGNSFSRDMKLNKMSDEDIAHTLLHELAHMYGFKRYGSESKQYDDEIYCDRFAERWLKKLKKEGLIL